jgi:hypothetical protein
MPPLRRLVALVCSLFLMLLTLRDGYDSCASHARPQKHARAAATHVMHVSRASTAAPTTSDGCDAEHLPSACSAMPACALTLTVPTSAIASAALRAASPTPREPIAIHSQPLAGPDAPPPRG